MVAVNDERLSCSSEQPTRRVEPRCAEAETGCLKVEVDDAADEGVMVTEGADEAMEQGAEAVAQTAEGLRLHLNPQNRTGYRGVVRNTWATNQTAKPFAAQVNRGGRSVFLGTYATACEAAVAYARYMRSMAVEQEVEMEEAEANGGQAEAAAGVVEEGAEAMEGAEAAEAEVVEEAAGLRLHLNSRNQTGYAGVHYNHTVTAKGRQYPRAKPYYARVWCDGRSTSLGYFATAIEAAVAYARYVGSAAEEEEAEKEEAETAEAVDEAKAAEDAEGLRLHLSARNQTGFRGVFRVDSATDEGVKLFRARVQRGGRDTHLGCYATARQAAVAYARYVSSVAVEEEADGEEAEREAEEEAVREAEEEEAETEELAAESDGLRLHLSTKAQTGYQGVYLQPGATDQTVNRFRVQVKRGGRSIRLGAYATAREAAVAYARYVSSVMVEEELEGEEAEEEMETEMLEAVEAANKADKADKADKAEKTEAADKAEAAEAAEAELVEEAEGLRLHLSSRNLTGYRGVCRLRVHAYRPEVYHNGRRIYLGYYATALEAAVAYARHVFCAAQAEATVADSVAETSAAAPAPADAYDASARMVGHVADDCWEVGALLERRFGPHRHGKGKGWHYLVRWEGWSAAHDTWELEDRIDPSLVVACVCIAAQLATCDCARTHGRPSLPQRFLPHSSLASVFVPRLPLSNIPPPLP